MLLKYKKKELKRLVKEYKNTENLTLDECLDILAEATLMNPESDFYQCIKSDDLWDKEVIIKDDLLHYFRNTEVNTELGYVNYEYLPENVSIKVVDRKFSSEEGSKMYTVLEFKKLDTGAITYVKFDGVYSSWDSSWYDQCYIVNPKKKLIIQWSKDKGIK